MRSCLIEIRDVRIEDALELSLLQDQQVIEAFLPHAPHEALTNGIGSWSVIGNFEQFDATGRRHPVETGSKFAIVISNEIVRCLPIRSRFPQLLRHPRIGRRLCHSHMDDLPRLQFDEEEGEERSKEEIRRTSHT